MEKKNETSSPTLKRSWFQELKAEFAKITWPTRKEVGKQSFVVLIIAVLLGALIAGVDFGWEHVINLVVG